MSRLERRIENLENSADGKVTKAFLWVEHASDGGLVHGGRFYTDADALLNALGHSQGEALLFGWNLGQTAAELLAEAEERAKNPPPEVTLDELGEYGRQLMEEEGVSPAVAKHLEGLRTEHQGL